jgi:serine/threonine-protein kinase
MGRVTRDVYTRDGPGLNYPIAGDLGGGQVVTVLGRDGRGDWFLVESPSGPVWVSKGYLDEASGSLTAVEMAATIPAQPTATPTTATTLVGDVTPVSLPEIGLLEPRPAACPPGANAPAYAADDTLAFRWTWPDDPPEGGYLEVRAGPVGRIVSQGRVDPAAHRQGDTWTFPVSGSTLFNPGDGAYQWAVYVIDGTGRPAMNSALSCFGLVGSGQPGPEQPPGSADSDGDGVPDSGDICPGQPAGNNPDPDYPGCPVPPPAVDSDGDGIVDSNDECPFDRPGPYPDPNRPGCPGSYP